MSEQKSTAKNRTVQSFCEYCSKELKGSWAFTFSKIDNGVITESAVSQKICAECALDLKIQVENITNEIKADLNNNVSADQIEQRDEDRDDAMQLEIEQPESEKNIPADVAQRGPEPIENIFEKPRGNETQKLSDVERKRISNNRLVGGRRASDNGLNTDLRNAPDERTIKNISDQPKKKQADIETLEQWLIKVKDQVSIVKVSTTFHRAFEGTVIAADHKGMIIATPEEQLFLPYSEIRYISISNPQI